MSYKLRFHELALKEWRKLDATLREQFKKKLAERLDNPHILSSALAGMPNCYKIKLRKVGYRLVYRVDDDILYVTVVAVGKRDKLRVYSQARERLA
ncbi:MAG: type II toxin-antitoxin system RelE/ParE family toxin [Desulfovibrio sp.]|jgi:mRNA interferase RelE/StbE|nr:type II toxin-antitoxin system RelE/ParE family toxin [Desulfovibrio sp.]MBI4960674.1 type II toxin-antitoxin system RelE/ParE family toxin [Desulfovibrio sp.]